MARIYFVRHGRTVLNEQRRTQGRSDSPLTPEGRVGAEICRDYLAEVPFTRAYFSPQGRVQETGGILLQAHPGVEPVNLTGLREYNYGIYDGGPDPVMHAALPAEQHLPAVLAGVHPGAPDGITAREYLADVDAALARILADLRAAAASGQTVDNVLVVSHGMTLMTIMARWVGPEIYAMAPMANCAVTTVEVTPAAVDGAPRLLAWAEDPGNQGVTYPVRDFSSAFVGVVPVPIDWEHPEGVAAQDS
ncbi:MAG: histidine phosphatase family protein [Actinomyces ruminicola]|uniref:Probable phosphoglycerate mutase n=1 Tax=Actinomyces ruminicola TaxID=332524 RepID=A0A1H0CBE4_9ACTO|nr:histidine phosphatase family protein [Actinomyces ruminicola]MBE6481972.1 histidine phosphatase family protein [Actinomyces ruminicola]SDN55195.1 probable phosphoglycerate mutase [Actinomyces ruminicola]